MPRYTVTVEEREFDITLDYHADHLVAVVNGQKKTITVQRLGDRRALLLIDNQSREVDIRGNGTSTDRVVFMQGAEIPVTVEDYALAQMRKAAGASLHVKGDTMLKAPMPGLVVAIKVEPGAQVKAGEPLLLIEAMKMENVLKAKAPGKIKTIFVKPGQSIEKDEKLIEFE